MATGFRERVRSRVRSLPVGLLAALALVASVERGVARHDLDVAPLVASIFRFAGKAARVEAPRRSVLAFGDSQVKYGLVPGVIEERTGRKAYNLAISSSTAPYSYFLLRQALRSGARPSAVVVGFKDSLFQSLPEGNFRGFLEVVDGRGCAELAWALGQPELWLRWAAGAALPTLRDREAIRASLLAGFEGRGTSDRERVLVHRRNWVVNQGAQILPKVAAPAEPAELWDEKAVLNTRLHAQPTNLRYVRKFFEEAAAHGVPVYLVTFPLRPAVRQKREALGLDARYDRMVLAEAARFPGVRVLDGRGMAFAAGDFADASHLDRDGAVAFSRAVADAIAEFPPPGRPVRLSAPRPAPGRARVEDLNESEVALRRAWAALRR